MKREKSLHTERDKENGRNTCTHRCHQNTSLSTGSEAWLRIRSAQKKWIRQTKKQMRGEYVYVAEICREPKFDSKNKRLH